MGNIAFAPVLIFYAFIALAALTGIIGLIVWLYKIAYSRYINRQLAERGAPSGSKRHMPAPEQVLLFLLLAAFLVPAFLFAVLMIRKVFADPADETKIISCSIDLDDANSIVAANYTAEDEIPGYHRTEEKNGDVRFVYYLADTPFLTAPQLYVWAEYTGDEAYTWSRLTAALDSASMTLTPFGEAKHIEPGWARTSLQIQQPGKVCDGTLTFTLELFRNTPESKTAPCDDSAALTLTVPQIMERS